MSEKQVLQINEKLRLRRWDSRNVVIEEASVTDPRRATRSKTPAVAHEQWVVLGYYGDWPAALNAIPAKALTGEAKQILGEIASLRADIQRLINLHASQNLARGSQTHVQAI